MKAQGVNTHSSMRQNSGPFFSWMALKKSRLKKFSRTRDRHLRLVDQHEEDHHAGRERALDGAEAQRSEIADGGFVVGAEEAVGDAGQRTHDRHVGNSKDHDGEHRDGERQRRRDLRLVERLRANSRSAPAKSARPKTMVSTENKAMKIFRKRETGPLRQQH